VTTFKQLEAFVAVVDLGSFEKAATSLETSQSNVSRQIASFEASFDVPLFNRDQRAVRLTMTGQEVLQLARGLLRQRSNLAERFVNPDLVSSTLRLGVTELAAMTWLGGFIAELRRRYPRMRLEPQVGSSAFLHSRVRDGQLDIAIVLSAVRTTEMARLPIGQAGFGWYCASALPISSTLTLTEFERQTLLLQGDVQSGGSVVGQWLQERNVHPTSSIPIDSLMALAGICAAGLGVAGMPRAMAQGPLQQGLLREIEIPIGAPRMEYIALVRIDAISDLHRSVAGLARARCDFATPFHGH
jgi:DNA-binding transcriptional LysR family regulator